MSPRQAWIFTHHAPRELFSGYGRLDAGRDLVVAVDGGLERVHGLGLRPDVIIGDFDSLSPQLLAQYPSSLVQRHPARKDETDTELAILWALERGVADITICNDLGGRFDHALALVQNLLLIHERGGRGSIESGTQRLFLIAGEAEFCGLADCNLSLLAVWSEVEFATSKGLQYPLAGVRLFCSHPRGMSNRIVASPARVAGARGLPLAIVGG